MTKLIILSTYPGSHFQGFARLAASGPCCAARGLLIKTYVWLVYKLSGMHAAVVLKERRTITWKGWITFKKILGCLYLSRQERRHAIPNLDANHSSTQALCGSVQAFVLAGERGLFTRIISSIRRNALMNWSLFKKGMKLFSGRSSSYFIPLIRAHHIRRDGDDCVMSGSTSKAWMVSFRMPCDNEGFLGKEFLNGPLEGRGVN